MAPVIPDNPTLGPDYGRLRAAALKVVIDWKLGTLGHLAVAMEALEDELALLEQPDQ